jgi:hypothetical protein
VNQAAAFPLSTISQNREASSEKYLGNCCTKIAGRFAGATNLLGNYRLSKSDKYFVE